MAHNHHPTKIAGDTLATMIVGGIIFFLIAPFLLYHLADVINGFGDGVRAVLGN